MTINNRLAFFTSYILSCEHHGIDKAIYQQIAKKMTSEHKLLHTFKLANSKHYLCPKKTTIYTTRGWDGKYMKDLVDNPRVLCNT